MRYFQSKPRGHAAKIAERIDVSGGFLSDAMRNRKHFRFETARKLARATGLKLDQIPHRRILVVTPRAR